MSSYPGLPTPRSAESSRSGRHKDERRPGLGARARENRSGAPSALRGPPSLVPAQTRLAFPRLAFSPLTPNWITMSASRPYTRVNVSGVTALQTAKARAKASSITSRGKSSE